MKDVLRFIYEYRFLVLSIMCFSIGVFVSVWQYIVEKIKRRKYEIPAAVWLTAGTALALFWINLGYDPEMNPGEGFWAGINGCIVAILGVVSTFGGNRGVDITQGLAVDWFGEAKIGFFLYADILHLAASAVVLVVIVKIIAKFFPRLIYNVVVHFRNLYIFSGNSERDILLAEDIRRMEKDKNYFFKSVMVFLKREEDISNKEGWFERIKGINGFVFDDSVESLYIPNPYRKKPINFFLMKESEDENMNDALRVAERFAENGGKVQKKRKKNICIHILSDSPEMEYMLDSIVEKTKCDVRLISETQSMIYQLLDQKPLYLGEKNGNLDILIVGCGRNGKEAAKICSWCGYTKRLTPNIWMIDKLEDSYRMLEKDSPEMVSQKNIHFQQMDVETSAFLEFLREHREFGYIICALGDEHLNLRTALQIRSVNYEWGPYDKKSKKLPIINVLLNNDDLNESCKGLSFFVGAKEEKTRSYDLNAFGSFKEFYKWNNIGSSYLEGGALAVHRFYSDSTASRHDFYESYKDSNYNRMSSMATALHAKYKVYTLMYEILQKYTSDEKEKAAQTNPRELVEYLYGADSDIGRTQILENVEELAELEYLRWNAYMRANGWRTAAMQQAATWKADLHMSKNMPAKLHPLVGKWNPGEGRSDIVVDESDKKLIWNLPFILEDASEFDDLFYDRKKKYDVDDKNDGNYTKDDFEAMAYWYQHPIKKNDVISLCGKKKKIQAYLNQALLMHVFLDNPPSYHIYSDDFFMDDFWAGKKEHPQNQIKPINEEIIIHAKETCVDSENIIYVDELLERGEISEYAIKELRYEMIERAKAINEAYSGKHSERDDEWMQLNAFTKGSNICSAAFVKMHRENYANHMKFDKMAEIEHIRWCRYHLAHGWRYGNPLDADKSPIVFTEETLISAAMNPKNRDEEGRSLIETKDVNEKWHTCLVSFDKLKLIEKIKPGVLENDKKAVIIGIKIMARPKKNEKGSNKKNE